MAAAEMPMYDLPELRSATDARWAGIARALRRGVAAFAANATEPC
jgi:hypothetical protein